MADEKIIRIGADASGFGSEINRMSQEAKNAFSDIGLDSLFEDADKQFDKLEDKIKNISDELRNKRKEADDFFDKKRSSNEGNDYYQRTISSEQDDYNKRHEKAISEWEKFVEKLRKTLNKNNDVNDDGSNNDSGGSNKKLENTLSRVFGNAGGELGQTIGRILPGNMGNILGRGLGNILSRGGANIGRTIAGGIEGAEGGAAVGGAETAAGSGAGGAAAGGGMAAAMSVAAVAAVVVAVAAVIKQLYGMGIDDWRTESKVNATFNIDRDTFGKGGDDFGLDNKEYKEFFLQAAKSRGSAQNIEDIGRKELSLIKGYGLSQGEVQAFDKFNYQDVRGKDGTAVIIDILSRSEKQGILGVSGGDFSRLPEKIEQVSNIMAFQKMSGEKVDSLAAVNFMAAGSQIGGRFGDDRASEVYGRMNESIKNPSNPGMKAFIFEMLKKANPGASFTDLQGMMENGASGDNLKAILPSIAKMPQGEMRRMVLYQLTKNMQDAIRLDKAGNLNAMINGVDNKGVGSAEAQSRYNEAMKRTENNLAALDQLGKIIENKLTDFGEKYIARPFNDMMRGIMQGNTNDIMRAGSLFITPMATPFIPQGFNSNTGQGGNNVVTGKPTH